MVEGMKPARFLEVTVFWLFTAGSLALVFALMLAPQYESLSKLSRELDITQDEACTLFSRICQVRADASAMRNSPYFIEKTARIDLGLRMPGESEMVLASTTSRVPVSVSEPLAPTFYERAMQPFAGDPLFRSAVFLTAVAMLFVALVGMSQSPPPIPELAELRRRERRALSR